MHVMHAVDGHNAVGAQHEEAFLHHRVPLDRKFPDEVVATEDYCRSLKLVQFLGEGGDKTTDGEFFGKECRVSGGTPFGRIHHAHEVHIVVVAAILSWKQVD